jgi:hypothetical protein
MDTLITGLVTEIQDALQSVKTSVDALTAATIAQTAQDVINASVLAAATQSQSNILAAATQAQANLAAATLLAAGVTEAPNPVLLGRWRDWVKNIQGG